MSTPKAASASKKVSSRGGANTLSNMTQDEAWQFVNTMNPACHAAALQYWNHINNNSGSKGDTSVMSAETSMPSFSVSSMKSGEAMRTRVDGMPCSEKEMKALMSMFVEVMGLQMNTDRLNQARTPETPEQSSSTKNKRSKPMESPTFSSSVVMPVFRFPANVPPPPMGWPDSLVWPPTEDAPPDLVTLTHSIPLLEPIPFEDRDKMIRFAQDAMKSARRYCKPYTPFPPVPGTPKEAVVNATDPVTGSEGIVPPEWQTQVRSAIEDALEQEELLGIRIRKHEKESSKAPKKSQGKSGPVPPHHPAAALPSRSMTSNEAASALQKVEDANRKLSKAVGMWRNRVVSAVTQNEVQKLELLLAESPLRTVTQMQQQAASVLKFHNQHLLHYNHGRAQVESVEDHLKQLVPLTVMAKFVAGVHGGGVETRLLLAMYICQEFSVQHFLLPGRNGRSVLHTACMMGDLSILQVILDKAAEHMDPPMLYAAILHPCEDSGWSSLHYAVSSGSLRVVQCLLQCLNTCSSDGEQCDLQKAIQCVSNDALSWKRGEPQHGITVQHLAVALMSHEPETMIETLGMALQEISNYRLRSNKSSMDPSVYVAMLSQITIHIILIQSLGYTPLTEEDILRVEQETPQYMEKCQQGVGESTSALAGQTEETDPPPWVDSDDETSRMTKADGKKKRKRKKKGKNSDAAVVSVASSSNDLAGSAFAVVPASKDDTSVDDESEVSKPSTSAASDPLVSALLGMGFEYASVMDGINSCGGMSRATADDVVAWIVGGGTTTANGTATQPAAPPKSAAKTEPSASHKKPVAAVAWQSELEKRNKEVVRQKEEERKLAAKREEQRRRNREWNTRAQARQIQEVQEKMAAKAAANLQTKPPIPGGGVLRSVSGGSNFTSGYPVSSVGGRVLSPTFGMGSNGYDASAITPSRMAAPTTTRSRLNLGPSTAESNRFGDNADGSTIASSVDHGIIEIGGNDDATVSTIGSFPAMYPPQAPPPGFANGPLLSSMPNPEGPAAAHRGITQAQWEAHRSMVPNDSYNSNSNSHHMGFGRMGLGPIIPETGPLPNFHGNYYTSMPTLPLNLSSHSSSMHPTMGSVSGTETDFVHNGGTNLFGSGNPTLVRNEEVTNFAGNGVFGSALLLSGYPPPTPPLPSNFLERSISAPSHVSSSFANDPSSPPLSNFFGFGSDMNQKAIDASMIDSISTGNAGISGSSLWGTPDARNDNGGSSLLRSLISSSNSDYPHETSLFSSTNESTDARFLNATTFHSKDASSWETEHLSKLHASQEGTIGPSIW